MICWYGFVHFVRWAEGQQRPFASKYTQALPLSPRVGQNWKTGTKVVFFLRLKRQLPFIVGGDERAPPRLSSIFCRFFPFVGNKSPGEHRSGAPNTTAAAAPFVRSPSIGQKVDFSARQGNRLFGATRSWHQPTETLRLAISTSGNTCFWTKGPERGKQYEILYLLNLYSERLLKLRDEPQRYFCSDKSERRSAEMLERPWVCSVASHILGFGISMFL